MKITLETVRGVMREAFGFESFIGSYITEIQEDPDCPTAGITKDGVLGYNPEFAARYLTCKEDLFSLLFHETLHPMFGHFIHGQGELENIAADSIINAVISLMFHAESNGGALFRKFYRGRGLEGLLRPQSQLGHSRYSRCYQHLYGVDGWGHHAGGISTGELIHSLKILTDTVAIKTPLLGNHDSSDADPKRDGATGWSQEALSKVAADIRRSVQKMGGKQAGYCMDLKAMLMEALRTHLSIQKALLQKFTTKRKVDKFKEHFRQRRLTTSPIPLHPSKRDLVLLAAGLVPLHFHNRITAPQSRDRGLAIYLDVSGSVNEYLPKIIGVLSSLRKEITTVFQFSNQVVETSFAALLKGEVQTTYGTDFDCIAKSIQERQFDKAIIITDGCADMQEEHKEQLTELSLKTLTILFGDCEECDAFAQFGDRVQLEDITDK